MARTYEGIVERGNVRLAPDVNLPDGTHVYVTVIPTLNERYARRKAALWLAENVGDMLMPGSATLIHEGGHYCWRFPIMLGHPFDEPRGPIGYVEVDANDGNVLALPNLAITLIQNAEKLAGSSSPSED
jgi:hypothetical protein